MRTSKLESAFAYQLFIYLVCKGADETTAEERWLDVKEGDEFIIPTGAKIRMGERWRWTITSYSWDGSDVAVDRLISLM